VIDANVLGDVCRDKDSARDVLDIVRKRSLTVIFCKEILNEYKPLFEHPDCKKHRKMLQEWYTLITSRSRFGKKVKIDSGTVDKCFSDLIRRKMFTEKDSLCESSKEDKREG
jgi:predicted nucleic acid-binding protein